ncbi:hypothetical protein H112_05679 [Trichophyton rubrum D6]|nr:hypothetical protein H112_05679 [Trichophyton rubrum D6]
MASFNIVGEIKTSIFQGCCVGTFHPCQEQKAKRPVNSRTRGKYHAVYSLQGSGCAMLRRLEPAVFKADNQAACSHLLPRGTPHPKLWGLKDRNDLYMAWSWVFLLHVFELSRRPLA